VGECSSSSISYCYNTGGIVASSSRANVGGIVGILRDSTIDKCFNTGIASAQSSGATVSAGGIVGGVDYSNSSKISNCFNAGNVKGSSVYTVHLGGMCGFMNNTSTIEYSYNIGSIDGTSSYYGTDKGGIVGTLSGSNYVIKNCYYLDDILFAVGNSPGLELANVRALTEVGMKYQSSFVGFDFDTVWEIAGNNNNNGYPTLR